MNIYGINLRQIIVFHTVASKMSMTKAAEELLVTQSAISQTILELEKNLTIKLFVRDGKKLSLTREGEELFAHTKKVILSLDETLEFVETLKRTKDKRISIGASFTIGNYLLSSIVKSFKSDYPEIDIDLFIGTNKEVLEKMKRSRINIGFLETIPHKKDDFECYRFIKDKLLFVCSPQHRFSTKPNVSLRELEGEPFVLRETTSFTRNMIEKTLESKGISITVAYEFNNDEAIKNAVSCNLGLSILSEFAVKNEISMRMLSVFNVEGISLSRDMYLIIPRLSIPTARLFKDYMMSRIRNSNN